MIKIKDYTIRKIQDSNNPLNKIVVLFFKLNNITYAMELLGDPENRYSQLRTLCSIDIENFGDLNTITYNEYIEKTSSRYPWFKDDRYDEEIIILLNSDIFQYAFENLSKLEIQKFLSNIFPGVYYCRKTFSNEKRKELKSEGYYPLYCFDAIIPYGLAATADFIKNFVKKAADVRYCIDFPFLRSILKNKSWYDEEDMKKLIILSLLSKNNKDIIKQSLEMEKYKNLCKNDKDFYFALIALSHFEIIPQPELLKELGYEALTINYTDRQKLKKYAEEYPSIFKKSFLELKDTDFKFDIIDDDILNVEYAGITMFKVDLKNKKFFPDTFVSEKYASLFLEVIDEYPKKDLKMFFGDENLNVIADNKITDNYKIIGRTFEYRRPYLEKIRKAGLNNLYTYFVHVLYRRWREREYYNFNNYFEINKDKPLSEIFGLSNRQLKILNDSLVPIDKETQYKVVVQNVDPYFNDLPVLTRGRTMLTLLRGTDIFDTFTMARKIINIFNLNIKDLDDKTFKNILETLYIVIAKFIDHHGTNREWLEKINYDIFKFIYKIIKNQKFINLENLSIEEADDLQTNNETINYFVDSVSMLIDDSTNMFLIIKDNLLKTKVKTAKDIKQMHDYLANIIVYIKSIHYGVSQEYKIIPQLEKFRNNLTYIDDNYTIYAPNDGFSIIKEGQDQSNCVASYADRHMLGSCTIAFMRKNDSLRNSFITIELRGLSSDNSGKLSARASQIYGRCNTKIKNLPEYRDIITTVLAWAEKNNISLNDCFGLEGISVNDCKGVSVSNVINGEEKRNEILNITKDENISLELKELIRKTRR